MVVASITGDPVIMADLSQMTRQEDEPLEETSTGVRLGFTQDTVISDLKSIGGEEPVCAPPKWGAPCAGNEQCRRW